jgi:hypothetical protein
MTSPDYDNQFLNALQECTFMENRAMDLHNRLANAAASHQSIPLTNQDLDTITERNQAWEKFLEIARRPY